MVSYYPLYEPEGIPDVSLDGDFTIGQLETLVNHMKKHNKEG